MMATSRRAIGVEPSNHIWIISCGESPEKIQASKSSVFSHYINREVFIFYVRNTCHVGVIVGVALIRGQVFWRLMCMLMSTTWSPYTPLCPTGGCALHRLDTICWLSPDKNMAFLH